MSSPPADAAHHAVALLLAHPAVQGLRPVAAAVERLGERVDLLAGAAEDDGRGRRLDVEDAAERRRLGRARHDVGGLADPRRLPCGRGLAAERDPDRLAQVAAGERVQPAGHRGREQHRLPGFRRLPQDRLEVLGEAHVEHLVGLVQDDGRDLAQVQAAALEEVERPPRRRDDDVDAGLQRPELADDRRAAVDRQHAGAEVLAVAVQGLGHLDGELAGRHEDERHGRPLAAVRGEPLEHRQCEGGRLARAGSGLAEQVAALDQGRDRLLLDRRRLLVAESGQCPQQLRPQAEVLEGDAVPGRGRTRRSVLVHHDHGPLAAQPRTGGLLRAGHA
jgi:hypothetical protein